MLLLDGNVFYAEVNYDHQKDMVSLVKGHYWAFNGRTAWKSVAERWKNETSQMDWKALSMLPVRKSISK